MARLVGTELRAAAAHSSEGIKPFCMAALNLLTEFSGISSIAVHDEGDMLRDGSEGEEEEKDGSGDGEEVVYEYGDEGVHGALCVSPEPATMNNNTAILLYELNAWLNGSNT